MCANSEGSSETPWMRRFAWAFAGRLSDKYHNLMSWSNPAGGEILPEPKRRLIAQSLSCSPFHRLEMTEILLKGRKTITHPSIMSWLKLYVGPAKTRFSLQRRLISACSVCFSSMCICLFILHMLIFFSSAWCQGLAAACDCGTSWTFLLTFLSADSWIKGDLYWASIRVTTEVMYLSQLMRLWHFSSFVNTFFKRACAAIRGRGELDVWFLVGPFDYFHTSCANSEGFCETVRMRRLAWAFAGRLCDKYHNLMSWLILPLQTHIIFSSIAS